MNTRTPRWLLLAALCGACTARSYGVGGFPLPDGGASEAALPDVVLPDVALPDVVLPTDAVSPGVDAPAVIDVSLPIDTGPAYPPCPYGSTVGQRVQPFALAACNRSGAFPMTLVVDRNARLRSVEYGVDQGLTGLRAQIEGVLANPDG